MIFADDGAQLAWAGINGGIGGFGMSDTDQFSFDSAVSAWGPSFSQVGTGFFLAIQTAHLHRLQGRTGLFAGSASSPNVPTPTPIPTPASLPLFATGLGMLGLLGWRRKRKPQGVA